MRILLAGLMLCLSASAFASTARLCGQITADSSGTALVFTPVVRGQLLPPSPIYSRDPQIDKELAQFVGFHSVCVLAATGSQTEGDTVVLKILSYLE